MDYLKIVVLGSGGVGKSALTVQYMQGIFVEKYDPTIEDCGRKFIEIAGKQYGMEILDTAGTQQFTAMRDLYMKNGEGFILVYSIIAQSTWNDIPDIYENIMRIKRENDCNVPPCLLVGNKIDLEVQRVISKESGEELSNQLGCTFMETSAKTPTNVILLFETCSRMIVEVRGPIQTKKRGGGCLLI